MKWLGLLLASLVANAVLLLARGNRTPATHVEHPRHPAGELMPSFPASAPPKIDLSGIERSALERRLATAEARLADLAPPNEKFAGRARSLETEERVKPFLDEVFAHYQAAEPKYTFECRGRVCKIDAPVNNDWTMPLQQTFPGTAIFHQMSFGRDGTFVELAPAEQIPGNFLSGMIMGALLHARTPCGFATSPQGELILRLEYDEGTRRITRDVTGSLAAQPVGACIIQALDDVIATIKLPPEMTRTTHVEQTVVLPVAADD
jgi:hypothetical protein